MKAIALTALLLAAPGVASAQDIPGGVGRSGSAQQRADAYAMQEAYGAAMRTHAMDEQQDQYRDTQSPRRIRLAQEAAERINHGDCDGARQIATRANDTRLATRIDQVCSASGNSSRR